jgi:hypothetical protein
MILHAAEPRTGTAAPVDRVTIVEFKTGRPRPEDESQVRLYTRAVRAAYRSATVDARIFYAGEVGTDRVG